MSIDHGAASAISIIPVTNLPEFHPHDDLASAIVSAADLSDGDILVVTSKIISKVENRIVPAPPDPLERDAYRRELILQEAVRLVATAGRTLITENHLGIVQAASGIDSSNVSPDSLLLLPVDPDNSARELRKKIHDMTGKTIAVIITDTMGRAWRDGQIDLAIGSAGIPSSHSYRGEKDTFNNPLVVTDIAIIDELASAADLVKGKLTNTPVAIIRGYPYTPDETATARNLLRSGEIDVFHTGVAESKHLGHLEAPLLRRSIRSFTDQPVPLGDVTSAIADALTAPAPHHSKPMRYCIVNHQRTPLLHALEQAWRADLSRDGLEPETIEKRIAKGSILHQAPMLVIPILASDEQHPYPDATRSVSEKTMFHVAAGAAVGTLLIALAARNLGSCWIGSTLFAPKVTRQALNLPEDWHPMGAVAIGYPHEPLKPRERPRELAHESILYR